MPTGFASALTEGQPAQIDLGDDALPCLVVGFIGISLGLNLFWCLVAITCTVNPTLYFNVNWLPTYFNQERGMAAGSGELKWILTLIYLGLDLGYLVFGFATGGTIHERMRQSSDQLPQFEGPSTAAP